MTDDRDDNSEWKQQSEEQQQYEHEMIEVCMYCGKERIAKHISCCGEMNFEFVNGD